MRITEVKRRLNGEELAFECEVLHLSPGHAVLRYVADLPPSEGRVTPRRVITEAYYWEGRNFLVWRMSTPEGQLLGHRFDICQDVRITPETVEWTDLVLDAWADVSGRLRFEDEEEVEEQRAQGLLTDQHLATIERTRRYLKDNYQRLIEEAVLPGTAEGDGQPTT